MCYRNAKPWEIFKSIGLDRSMSTGRVRRAEHTQCLQESLSTEPSQRVKAPSCRQTGERGNAQTGGHKSAGCCLSPLPSPKRVSAT